MRWARTLKIVSVSIKRNSFERCHLIAAIPLNMQPSIAERRWAQTLKILSVSPQDRRISSRPSDASHCVANPNRRVKVFSLGESGTVGTAHTRCFCPLAPLPYTRRHTKSSTGQRGLVLNTTEEWARITLFKRRPGPSLTRTTADAAYP